MLKNFCNKYFKPDKIYKNVSEIDFSELKTINIKGIILDLDDTLLPSDSKSNIDFIDEWLTKAKENFHLFVLSNNHRPSYVKNFCDKFQIPFIAKAGKPRRKFLKKAIAEMKLEKDEVVIIGDRIITDILVGKRLGTKTFLVKPLTQKPSIFQKTIYLIEKHIMNSFVSST